MVWNELMRELDASYRRVGSPKRVLVACSGGADSVALLRGLVLLREHSAFELLCVHVNHGLRTDAALDEAFVEKLCAEHKVPYQCITVSIPTTGNVEAQAREARHTALRNAASDFGADAIALGHHQDDQVETMMLRLLHGTGLQGLAAMREWRAWLWRPWLPVRRSTIVAGLNSLNQSWREDLSNADLRFTRNRVRAEVLPVLESINPAAVANMARTSGIFADEQDYWISFADAFLNEHAVLDARCMHVSGNALIDLPIAAQRQVLRGFAAHAGLQPDLTQLEALRSLEYLEGTRYTNLPQGWRGFRSSTRLYLLAPQLVRLPLGVVKEGTVNTHRSSITETFDMDKLAGAVLRYRQAGDRIHPLGGPGSKKLSDYLTDRKVDLPLRDHWPMYCVGKRVLWVPGIGLGQDAAVTSKTSRKCVLSYHGRLPDENDGYGGRNNEC